MPFVLDASTALAWCFDDEATAETEAVLDRLGSDTAMVPALWELEISNVLLVAERRQRVTEAQSTRFVSLLAELPIHIATNRPDMHLVLAAARGHRLSAYDATYLVLAEHEGVPLTTRDRRLASAARSAGVALLGDP